MKTIEQQMFQMAAGAAVIFVFGRYIDMPPLTFFGAMAIIEAL